MCIYLTLRTTVTLTYTIQQTPILSSYTHIHITLTCTNYPLLDTPSILISILFFTNTHSPYIHTLFPHLYICNARHIIYRETQCTTCQSSLGNTVPSQSHIFYHFQVLAAFKEKHHINMIPNKRTCTQPTRNIHNNKKSNQYHPHQPHLTLNFKQRRILKMYARLPCSHALSLDKNTSSEEDMYITTNTVKAFLRKGFDGVV